MDTVALTSKKEAQFYPTFSYRKNGCDDVLIVPLSQVLPYLGSVSMYRTVCKSFVTKHYVKTVVMTPQSRYYHAVSVISERPLLKNIVFVRCEYVNGTFLDWLMSKKTEVKTIIIDRCCSVDRYPRVLSKEVYRERLGCRLMLKDIDNKRCIIHFRGCWKLFHTPKPDMSPMDVVDIFMNALNHIRNDNSAVSTLINFTINDSWLCMPTNHLQHYIGHDWTLKNFRINGHRAWGGMVVTAYRLPVMWELRAIEEQNVLCWKIRAMVQMYTDI